MSDIEKSLRLLALAERYTVEEYQFGEGYTIVPKNDENLQAHYGDGDLTYFVTGIYNSGANVARINIEELDDLREFCQSLLGGDA